MGDPVNAEFDDYASRYDAALAEGLRFTGEDKAYYARRRVRWFARLLRGRSVTRVLDFGCGDGDAAPLLRAAFGDAEVVGVDVSSAMVERAAARHPWARFAPVDRLVTLGTFDAAYSNGVFHHIAPAERPAALRAVRAALRPGGHFGLWENHPWNPGTRLVMGRIPFDRDAELLSPPAARRLARANGFGVVRTDHLFIFPSVLGFLRPLERFVSRLPIGGQYQLLLRRRA